MKWTNFTRHDRAAVHLEGYPLPWLVKKNETIDLPGMPALVESADAWEDWYNKMSHAETVRLAGIVPREDWA